MVAKSKRTLSNTSPDPTAQGADVPGISGVHLRALQHREDLLEEARTLRRDGKIREAKGIERRAQQVEQLVGALEGEVRPVDIRSAN